MNSIRLDKFISSQMNISRNDTKKLVRSGVVSVNGSLVKKSDIIIDADADAVSVAGKILQYKKFVYIMQYKPKGVVSSTDSPGDTTVIDILPPDLVRSGLFPAGRLDKYTTGFVLITDDGEFAHNMLSPSRHVVKSYEVDVREKLSEDDMKRFSDGMIIGKESFKPANIEYMLFNEENSCHRYLVEISEGRYHQIRRMFDSVGNGVIELKRIKIGKLPLDDALQPGESREISETELKLIQA